MDMRLAVMTGTSVVLYACSSPIQGNQRAPNQAPEAIAAPGTLSTEALAVAVTPVAFDRPGGAVLNVRALPIVAVGPATAGPDAPQMPPWVVSAAVTTCTSATSNTLNCPSSAPNPSLCTSRVNLPAGCQVKIPPGSSIAAGSVPACCP